MDINSGDCTIENRLDWSQDYRLVFLFAVPALQTDINTMRIEIVY